MAAKWVAKNTGESSEAATDPLPQGEGEQGVACMELYGTCAARDVLEAALVAVVRNGGKPGADGITVEQVNVGREAILDELQTQLRERSYRPSPVLRVWDSQIRWQAKAAGDSDGEGQDRADGAAVSVAADLRSGLP